MILALFFATSLTCLAQSADPTADLMDLARALGPSYVNEGPEPDIEKVGPLLEKFLLRTGDDRITSIENLDEENLTYIFERLAPNLQERHTDLIAAGLVEETWADPNLAAELLVAAPYSQARVALARFALATHLHGEVRIDAVARILEADGRAGLDRIRPLLTPESYAGILKRIYFYWGAMAVEDDLPFLEELVLSGPGMCREFALQTWAKVETRPGKRLEIFRLSAFSNSSYRSVVLRILATHGPSADLEEHVRAMLSAPRSEDRRLALDLLSYVAGPEALLEEFNSTVKDSDSPDVIARWMSRLSRLNLPEARAKAATWILDQGWQQQRYATAVIRSLAKTDELDSALASFLNREEIPFELRLSLASGRAVHSDAAADFLRTIFTEAKAVHAVRVAQILGAIGGEQNIQALFFFAMDPARDGISRAAAIRQISRQQQAPTYLRRLLEEAPHSFETAEALITALFFHGDPDLRSAGLKTLENGFPSMKRAESEGLMLAAWRAQAAKPISAEADNLVAEFVVRITHAADPFDGEEWPRPRELSQEFGDLMLLAQATAASSPRAFRNAIIPKVGEVAPAAVYVVAEAVLEIDPGTGLALASALASRSDLPRLVRVRCLGLVARAAQASGQTLTHLAALDRILKVLIQSSDPGTLYDLGYGLALSSARGWLLPQDQILQRRILAFAASQSPDHGRPAAIRPLASGGCPVPILLDAVDLLLVPTEDDPDYIFPSNTFLAEDLCLKAIDMEPGSVRAHYLLAIAYQAQESPEEAIVQLDEVLRLAPPGAEYAVLAAEDKQQLLTTLKEEQ